jgi:hypothetical protein
MYHNRACVARGLIALHAAAAAVIQLLGDPAPSLGGGWWVGGAAKLCLPISEFFQLGINPNDKQRVPVDIPAHVTLALDVYT